MSRYTLKTYCRGKLLEVFEHRSKVKLTSILTHPRHHKSGQTGPFGEEEEHADRFEIFDAHQIKLWDGDVQGALLAIPGFK